MADTKNLDNIWEDLSAWQTEINTKDETLLRRKPVHDQALPLVRKSTEIILDNLKPTGLDSLAIKKAHAKAPTPTPVTTTKKNTPQTRAEKAEAEKAKGNEYFGKKDYKNAIIYYGKAIDLDPTVPVYFVNRAMAYLKINSFLEAEKDCTRGIQLQPKNVKALWRRGIALRELGRISEAKRDFEMGLTIEPSNKSILEELKKLPAPKANEKPKESKTVKSEPVAEQKRRLPINVIDEAYSESKLSSKPQQPTKMAKVEEAPAIKKSTDKKSEIKPAATPKNAQVKSTATASTIPEVEATSTPKPPQGKATTMKTLKITEITPTTTSTNKDTVPVVSKPVIKATAPPAKPSTPINFTCPRTNFEFERDWKTYKGRNDDILYQYFQCIPPSSYVTIFKSSLESDQFEKMIELVETRYVKEKLPQDIFNVLEGLSLVKRVDMLIMFLGKKHQQAIQGLFDLLKASDVIPVDRLTKIAKIYSARI